jgi:hypothetical protein
MEVITLDQFGETRFLQELKDFDSQQHVGDRRNKDWFSRIPEIYKTRFKEWFFLMDGNRLVAFSTIQEFKPLCYRLWTRTYYHPDYRRNHLRYEQETKTPAMYLLDKQVEYVKKYETLFISMQGISRRPALIKVMKKINDNWQVNPNLVQTFDDITDKNCWQLHPNMVQTCNEITDKNCWQNVIFIGKSPSLPSITIDAWHSL